MSELRTYAYDAIKSLLFPLSLPCKEFSYPLFDIISSSRTRAPSNGHRLPMDLRWRTTLCASYQDLT